MYKNYYTALFQMSSILFAGFRNFENDFAPLPAAKDLTPFYLLMNLVSVGAVGVSAPFFNSCKLPEPVPQL